MTRIQSSLSGTALTITDTWRDKTLLTTTIIHNNGGTGVTAAYSLEETEWGCDLTVTLTNGAGVTRNLGWLNLNYFNLEDSTVINRRTYTPLSAESTVDDDEPGSHLHYPGDCYAPLFGLTTTSYHLGVSLQYDAATYGFGVERWIVGVGTGRYALSFRFVNTADSTNYTLAAGASRTFTISIRFRPVANHHWLETLTPYRDFFRATFGNVKYRKDGRIVRSQTPADTAFYNASTNPRSWKSSNLRPDTNGFGPLIAQALSLCSTYGFERYLLWSPAGLQTTGVGLNYPPRFLTGLNESGYSTALASLTSWTALPAADIQLGFWWGLSPLYQPTWNSTTGVVPFDYTNSTHKSQATSEMSLATSAGATLIGLDAFTFTGVNVQNPVGLAINWFEYIRTKYPKFSFVGEQLVPDFLHVRMGNYFTVQPPTSDVSGPWELADFLNPGHETFVQFNTWPSWATTDALKQVYVNRLLSFGYTPISDISVVVDGGKRASDTWLTHYPSSLIS